MRLRIISRLRSSWRMSSLKLEEIARLLTACSERHAAGRHRTRALIGKVETPRRMRGAAASGSTRIRRNTEHHHVAAASHSFSLHVLSLSSLSSLSPHNYAHTHSGTLLLLLQTAERRGGRIIIMRCDLRRTRAPSHLIRVVERRRTLSESSARRHDTRRAI